jgi:hypothetical protein
MTTIQPLRRSTLLLASVGVLTLAAPSAATAQIYASTSVQVGLSPIKIGQPAVLPPLVVVQPGVQVVQDLDEEVFFVGDYYWARRAGAWYRTRDHRAYWAPVEPRWVPVALGRIPAGYYRYWHAGYPHHDWRHPRAHWRHAHGRQNNWRHEGQHQVRWDEPDSHRSRFREEPSRERVIKAPPGWTQASFVPPPAYERHGHGHR